MATKWTPDYNRGHAAGFAKAVRRALVMVLGGRCQAPDCLVRETHRLHVHHAHGNGAVDRLIANSSGGAAVLFLYLARFCKDPTSLKLFCGPHHREADRQLQAAAEAA